VEDEAEDEDELEIVEEEVGELEVQQNFTVMEDVRDEEEDDLDDAEFEDNGDGESYAAASAATQAQEVNTDLLN
jgi:hypothetical protein